MDSTCCETRKLEADEVLEQIQSLEQKRVQRESIHPASFGNRTLIAYIQEKYHDELNEELPALAPYVTRIAHVHGERDPQLLQIQKIFNELGNELIEHTEDEDDNVFPLILKFLKYPTHGLKEQVTPHVSELENEHENAGPFMT